MVNITALFALGTQEAVKTTPHDDVTKWKYFPRYWPLVRGIHRSPHLPGANKLTTCQQAPYSTLLLTHNAAVNVLSVYNP